MGLEATAVPLAFLAGVVGVLSPCVWPLVPVVMSSASMSGKSGPYWLAGGMSLSFAVAGTGLTFLLVQAGIDPEFFRHVAAMLLIVAAAFLLVPVLKDWASRALSGGLGRLGLGGAVAGDPGSLSSVGQFGTGVLLGVVWLPCVGPTLGAAIALASMGQSMPMAFVVMLAYGVGTAGVLLGAGLASESALRRWRGGGLRGGAWGTRVLGGTLLAFGFAVLLGLDKWVETQAVRLLPSWVFMI
jgi:cytochrome c-type biogenesis protein